MNSPTDQHASDPPPSRGLHRTACGAFDFHAELKIVIAEKCNNDEMPPDLLGKHRTVLRHRLRR